MNLKSGRFLSGLASGLVAVAVISGGAYAVTDTVFKYTAPKTGYFSVSHLAMVPLQDTAAFFNGIGGTGLTVPSTECFSAGVNLPHGAKMTQLAFVSGSITHGNPVVYLLRQKLSDGTQDIIASATNVSDTDARITRAVAIANDAKALTNNAHYAYALHLCMFNGDNFYGARIIYTYTHAGD